MEKSELKQIIKNFNVLFVDDEAFVVQTMKEILPLIFKDCFFALDGQEGINIFRENAHIDLVITDLSMPKMNGIEMIKTIKKIKPTIKVIFVSGHNESNYLDEAKQLSGEFIIKPINSTELYTALEKVVTKQ